MKEQLIDFETAKLAKEKGFDLKCNSYHYKEKGNYDPTVYTYDCVNSNSCAYHDRYSAPTQSLLQKWLRENHFILIEIEHHDNFGSYSFIVKNVHTCRKSMHKYDTYEIALEMALIEALKLIK